MKIINFKAISYDLNVVHLIGTHNCNDLGDYAGFMSIPSKYNNCPVIYLSVTDNTLVLQIDDN